MRVFRRFMLLAATLVVAAVAIGAAAAANTNPNGATKYMLYHMSSAFCDFVDFGWADLGSPSASTAVMQYDKSLVQVGETIHLKGAIPNATYFVRIGQNDLTSCFADLGSFTTNSKGNGSFNVVAPATSTTAVAFVMDYADDDYYATDTIYTHP